MGIPAIKKQVKILDQNLFFLSLNMNRQERFRILGRKVISSIIFRDTGAQLEKSSPMFFVFLPFSSFSFIIKDNSKAPVLL